MYFLKNEFIVQKKKLLKIMDKNNELKPQQTQGKQKPNQHKINTYKNSQR